MPQFDPQAEFSIPVRTDAGRQRVPVRYPTDEEWGEWYRARKLYIAALGRGQSSYDADDADADAKLYSRIRCADAPDLDPAEAHEIAAVLARFDVRDVKSEGDELELTAAVMGGEVVHRLRIPSVKQVAAFRREASQMISLPYNKSRLTSRLEPGARLWEACLVTTGGYANGSIPAVHKDAAVRAAMQHVEAEADASNP